MEKLEFVNASRNKLAPNCPCGKSNKDGKFTPIKGMDPQFGKCHSCGKLFMPETKKEEWKIVDYKPEPTQYIPQHVFGRTLQKYGDNDFSVWLALTFGLKAEQAAREQFMWGTARGGKTIFWQIDRELRVRTGKVQYHSPTTGKRDKKTNNWAHSMMNLEGRFVQCLYGVHQVNIYPPDTPIILTESSKNAICGYINSPSLIWLGTDGATALTNAKAEEIKGRKVILMPDADKTGRERFVEHSAEILENYDCLVEVIDLFPELEGGEDIADMLSGAIEGYDPSGVKLTDGLPEGW